MTGFILLHKKILECEWYTDISVRVLFLDLLVRANYKPMECQGKIIERGQFIGTIPVMAENSGLTQHQVRRCLHVLEMHRSITIDRTNKYSIITLCNWDKYQTQTEDERRQKRRQKRRQNNDADDYVSATYDGEYVEGAQTKTQTKAQTKIQINKNNILNNIKKVSTFVDTKEIEADASTTKNDEIFGKPKKSIEQQIAEREAREKAFYTSLIPYVEIYGKDMVRAFFDYWREPNRSGTKMRCELQQTWSLPLRLSTWSRKETKQIKYENNGKSKREKLKEDFAGLAVEIGEYIASRSGETLPDDII